MPLSAPAPRNHLHTRKTEFRGYLREDGLWDIEAQLTDTKTYSYPSSDRGEVTAGTPIHGMTVRLTIDEAMVIVAAECAMDHTPFGECTQAAPPLQGLVGATLGPGWRKAIDRVLGSTQGCTHMRELLFNAATAAYQTVWPRREFERRQRGEDRVQPVVAPAHLGKCMAWALDSPVTQRLEPLFYRPRAAGSDPA